MQKKKSRKTAQGLRVIQPDVAGIDLGSREHYVCCPPRKDGMPNVRSFKTTTPELVRLADWLKDERVQSVAMESTGVYWIPLYELLESRGVEVVLASSKMLSRVPGRKTDMLDCQWIQRLHSCGLLKGAFRPNESICRWRTLVREKNMMEGERSDWVRRIQKSLDQMNIQVHHAVSDITGQTGMSIIRAIVAGERDPQKLAEFRDPRCKKSAESIAEHLTGNWREEHLFVLKQNLGMYDHMCTRLEEYQAEILKVLESLQPTELKAAPVPEVHNTAKRKNIRKRGQEPMRMGLYLFSGVDLTGIDGISTGTAETVLSEMGSNLEKFPTEKHFTAYVNLAPKLAISGGKPIRKKPRGSGPNRIGTALKMAAVSLRNSKTALGAEYRRIARRKGAGVAVFAMARKLAILIYRMLRWGQAYVDEGCEVYEKRFEAARLRSCQSMAKNLGYRMLPVEMGTVQ
jgi:transposase